MASYIQQNRRLMIETPLGKDVLLLTGFQGREEMSRLFTFDLQLVSESDSLAVKDIVGKNVTFAVKRIDDELRHFNGFVSRFAYVGRTDRLSLYSAKVVPWFWFLTRTADCRIFQNKDVKEIVEQIFSDLGFTHFETGELKGKYAKREYCVQYRETDFNFVSRLLEEEGIFYYFRHENGKHVMVLADTKQAYQDAVEKEVEMLATKGGVSGADHILSWEHSYEYRPGKWAHTDYNFETPSTNLAAKTSTLIDLENITKFEMYDYPGLYSKKADGESLVKIRMQEEEAPYDTVQGASICTTFGPGYKFTLKEHDKASEAGKPFVTTIIEHRATSDPFESSSGANDSDGFSYRNNFVCIPSTVVFRPARLTPKPVIHGSQTAVVVGPAGEEIFTDKYGRIKVQFHWDREGKKDDKSSCWVRVSQPWAGKGWGAIAIPRIGHEVVVSFLEGDPDRPLITGSVYNAELMPPYPLPDNKTMTAIKSSSSKGGAGFNEIRIEDKKGEEQIFVHGQKDVDIRILNDCKETIMHDSHQTIKNDQFAKVEGNSHQEIVKIFNQKIGQDHNIEIKGSDVHKITGSLSRDVGEDVIEKVKGNQSLEITGDLYIKAANIVIEANQNLTLKVGQTYIAMESSGTSLGTTGNVEVKATQNVQIEATSNASIKGTAGLKLESPAQTELSGAMTTVKASGIMTVQGSLVKIN